MAEKKKAGRPVEETPTKIEGDFLDVFKVIKENKEQNTKKPVMNKYRFLITQDGKDQLAQEYNLTSIEEVKVKLQELCDEYIDMPIPTEYPTVSKPYTTQVMKWDDERKGWFEIPDKDLQP